MRPQRAGEPQGPLLSPSPVGLEGPRLGCPLLVGTELWHARCTSGPGSRRPGLTACIPCPHPRHAGARRRPGWCSWMWRELIEHRPEAALISAEAGGRRMPRHRCRLFPPRGRCWESIQAPSAPRCHPRSRRESGFIRITTRQGPAAAAGRSDGQLPPAQPHAWSAAGMAREPSSARGGI